uniref:DNA methyltransferase 1-associated protein 1 n=2 Tax=Clastoptera arizonana TaxID=38151 RepID=A0A1B6C5W3_9HEMI
MADVRDILEIERGTTPELTKETILGNADKQRKKLIFQAVPKTSKRPEGMHREVFALLYNDNKDAPPLFPSDSGQGYKQLKAKLGVKKVRPWRWMPFTNPARKDGAHFHHWRRVADEGIEYPFAKFNKQVPVPTYTDSEYGQHLQSESWVRAETDHLFDLCRRFDLRFVVIKDRWDSVRFPDRSVEDLKERYYHVCGTLTKIRAGSNSTQESKIYVFDADHERQRKKQLNRLYERTPEQVEEEQNLLSEYRKIEARKKERDKKTQDLQKLITAADIQNDPRKQERKIPRKKLQHQARPRIDTSAVESAGIKFPDLKSNTVYVRSQKMKLPANIGQKRMKAIEQMLQDLNIELNPVPTEEICNRFNELRSDMVLLYELKTALATYEFELQTLRHQYEAFNQGKALVIPSAIFGDSQICSLETSKQKGNSSEIIDVVGTPDTSSSM